jgi:hypothetical protein
VSDEVGDVIFRMVRESVQGLRSTLRGIPILKVGSGLYVRDDKYITLGTRGRGEESRTGW